VTPVWKCNRRHPFICITNQDTWGYDTNYAVHIYIKLTLVRRNVVSIATELLLQSSIWISNAEVTRRLLIICIFIVIHCLIILSHDKSLQFTVSCPLHFATLTVTCYLVFETWVRNATINRQSTAIYGWNLISLKPMFSFGGSLDKGTECNFTITMPFGW